MKLSNVPPQGSGINSDIQNIFIDFHQKFIVTFRKKMGNCTFTLPQIETLRFISEQKNPTMKEIASYLKVSSPSVTSMINHLSAKDLIKRVMDPSDRRAIRISLTTKTAKLFSIFEKAKIQVFEEMLQKLDDKEKKQLAVLLKKLI